MDKTYKTLDELINILESKNVNISDKNIAKYYIEKYSYYSIINTYKWIFKVNGKYKDNASFEEIFAMYKFDKNLKIILLKYILEIESIIKTKIANIFSENYGINNYLKIDNFDLKKDKCNILHIEKLILEINAEMEKGNGKHDAITHYYNKYSYVPPWVVTKILSLGTISKFYGLMKQSDRQKISKYFKLSDKLLKQILINLTVVRNICAHSDRLFTYRNKFDISFKNIEENYSRKDNICNLYMIVKCMKVLLDEEKYDEFDCLMKIEIAKLKERLESVDVKEILKIMGYNV